MKATLVLLLLALGWSMPTQAKNIYLKPTSWITGSEEFALYSWGGTQEAGWVNFVVVDATNNVYKATIADDRTGMIFGRMNPSRSENNFDWGNIWNKSSDLSVPTDDNILYTITEGRWGIGESGENGAIADGDGLTTEAYTEPVAAGYTVDFNTAITTSNHDFAVAKGWSHIVPNSDYDGYGPYYMSYSYYASMGVDGTGALWAGRQYAGDNSGGEVVKDILVTPLVNGTITLDVKAYSSASSSNPAFVEVYAINADGTLGSLLKTVKEDIAAYNGTGTADWATFTLAELTAEQKLGLRCQYVYIDNFTTASVNIPAERKLEVTKVANLEGATGTDGTTTYFEQQADGTLKVQLQVTLTNTGDYDFAVGDEGYSLTLASASYASGSKTYYDDATVNISEALAAGESKTFDVDFFIPFSTGWKYYFVRENVSGTTSSSSRYAGVTAYESKFVLREAGSSSTSDLTTAQDYGRVSATTTRSFEIYNDGTAPLTIKSITLPEGFTSDNLPEIPAEGLVVAKKSASPAFNVTLPVDVIGDFSGNLVIEYVKAGETEVTTKTLAFSGSVLAEGTWFADFNGDKTSSSAGVYPEGSVVTSSTGLQFGYTGSYGSYDHYLKSYSSAGVIVMPKLTATAGATLKYDAVRYQSGNYTLKVYVSTDRDNLGDAKATINNSDLESNGNYTQTLTIDEAGDYYVAFELLGVGLDNVIGLTKTEVAHDVYFKETKLVEEAQTGKEIKPNVKVVPLTDETADSYTVKYYVDGEAVATGTSVELTASATADKTFTISYTPTDEVTTEHDTYIAFEFTDGTVIATEHKTLKVTNEPKFLFVAASTSVNDNTTNLTTAQAYGKTNSADVKNFKIYNRGTAKLQVTSIVAPEGFTVSPNAAFEVAVGESMDVEVTFSTETPGDYSGNLVVTYEQEGTQIYELAFSGTKLDPNKWYANFDNPTSNEIVWPAGLVYESNIQPTYSGWGPYNYQVYTSSSVTTNNKVITPKLEATAGETFSFDVAPYSSWTNGTINIYLSTDRETWGEAIESITVESAQGTSTFVTKSVTIDTAGEYYVGIEITNAKVDELNGLKLADVAHDWKIASSSIPTEGMQNVAYTASVNILNLGLQDEEAGSYEVTAYVDGEAVATGEAVAIPMNHKLNDAGTQLSVNIIYPQVGTFPVYLEVKAGDYSVQTEPVNVTFAEEEAKSEIATGESAGTDGTTPLNMYYKNSETIALYPQNVLGLNGGEKIKSITYKGYSTKTFTSSFKVYYEWTDDKTISNPSFSSAYDVSSMTKAIDESDYSWAQIGSSTELGDMIVISFDTPIEYEAGKSLRILVSSSASNDAGYNSFMFEKSTTTGLAYQHQNDGTKGVFTSNWNAKNLPLIHLELEASAATLAGNVRTSAGAGIANATVTLKAENGVEYSATSDAEGNYSMNVVQGGLDFTATVEAEGFLKREFAENLGGESKTLDVTMYTQYGIVGSIPGLSWDEDAVMTQDEENPMVFTLVKDATVEAGVEYEYKLRADGAWGLAYKYQLPAGDDNYKYTFEKAGTYTLTFTADVAEHTLVMEPALKAFTLTEDACEDGKNLFEMTDEIANLTVERTFNAGWNAVVLPFALTQEEVTTTFGEGSKVAYFNGDTEDANGNVTVKFDELTGDLDANVPYMIYVATATTNPTFNNKTFVDPHGADLKAEVLGTAFDFMGTYVNLDVNAGDMFVSGGKFKTATTNNYVRAFRAYLKSKTEGARQVNIFVDGEEISIATPTAIDGIDVENVDGNVYNINGQRVNKNVKHGVYIINGKKVVRK